tara:strand:- start:149 stop:295 length:147 start_codon:yes stop_codon:yes gene_type:complete
MVYLRSEVFRTSLLFYVFRKILKKVFVALSLFFAKKMETGKIFILKSQ